jgi:beta-lactamase regulating signal transducer with metallopeptidase domain
MSVWLNNLESLPVDILAQVTLILLAAIAARQFLARSAAARHAVLFWALTVSGVCPLLNFVSRALNIAPLSPVSAPPVNSPARAEVLLSTLEMAANDPARARPSLATLWGAVWLVGMVVALARLGRGLHLAHRIRRAALPVDRKLLEPLAHRLSMHLGCSPPPILVSDRIDVPMAVGCLQSVVLLPSALAATLDDRKLLHVLLHECAHAVRRDPLVGLGQRLLAAGLWFHPLVHVANRWLDRAREELCDNAVLQAATPTDYSRTLVSIAESISHPLIGFPAQALFQSAPHLDDRVAGLLNPGRCTMTRIRRWRIATIALAFVAGGWGLACLAAPSAGRNSGYDVSHIVNFEIGRTDFKSGDSITIDEVHGTSDTVSAGNLYIMKGSYHLASEKSAMLAAFVTGDSRDPKAMEMQNIPTQRTQTMTIDQGDGRFTLIVYLWYEGNPHISFYPAGGGNSFGGIYFGTGASTFK